MGPARMDRRLTPANDRVVAAWLDAEFPDLEPVEPEAFHVSVPVVDLSLDPGGKRDRQLLYGFDFAVLEMRGELAFGFSKAGDYVGWVARSALAPDTERGEAARWVAARQTHAYSAPDFKAPERMALPHLSILSAGREEGRFTETDAGWVPTRHLDHAAPTDPVAVAELYLGTPYLWGGNSSFGIDCSGLVRAGLLACGLDCPGDSDLQEASLGTDLGNGPLRRGDLMFWKGHVAWVASDTMLLHANVHHMAVAYEGIDAATLRIEAQGDGPVTARKRLEGLA